MGLRNLLRGPGPSIPEDQAGDRTSPRNQRVWKYTFSILILRVFGRASLVDGDRLRNPHAASCIS